MRRLYLQVYLTLVGILVLFTLVAAVLWFVDPPNTRQQRALEGVGEVLARIVPPASSPREEQQAALEGLAKQFDTELTLRDADGELLAVVGDPVRAPRPGRQRSGWLQGPHGPAIALRLPDGRWLMGWPTDHGHSYKWLGVLVVLALLVALGAYPVVRRLTRRLERLQTRVDQLGAGDLSARVDVEGKDEVADLARSFNRAAQRIENLVNAQRTALASASHELRSPLARIRMATELMSAEPGQVRPDLARRIDKDITELDELIGELLLASRLDTTAATTLAEDVDLLALVAEEAARCEATLAGDPVQVRGDPRMLRRLVRNLLENARRHAAGTPIEVSLAPRAPGGAWLRVLDRGPGVPEGERERIFEPFYRRPGLRESVDGGVGLGLALVRQIARHHGGTARCLPREGGGTCFEIELAGAN